MHLLYRFHLAENNICWSCSTVCLSNHFSSVMRTSEFTEVSPFSTIFSSGNFGETSASCLLCMRRTPQRTNLHISVFLKCTTHPKEALVSSCAKRFSYSPHNWKGHVCCSFFSLSFHKWQNPELREAFCYFQNTILISIFSWNEYGRPVTVGMCGTRNSTLRHTQCCTALFNNILPFHSCSAYGWKMQAISMMKEYILSLCKQPPLCTRGRGKWVREWVRFCHILATNTAPQNSHELKIFKHWR